DPVGPDETLVIAGGNFDSDAIVEFRVLSDARKTGERKWTTVKPLQATEISLKAVVPATWKPGVYACRVRQGKRISKVFFVNAPDVWWKQGDEGVDRARQGGWLRILGKCLDITGGAAVTLVPATGGTKPIRLELEDVSGYSLKARLSADLRPGTYRVIVHNGKGGETASREAGTLELLPALAASKTLINVVDLGADPLGMKDSTLAIVQATERLSALGGGVVFFPRGRYRIDSILRSGTWIASPILIPENVTFRGEGPDLVSLWWPDREKALPTLIDGRSDFAMEDLSIYTQGPHSTIITGASNVRIRNVRIRANCYYMTNNNGGPHHRRKVDPPGASGAAILLWGDNNQVTDCDIYTSALAFDLRSARGSRIAHNTICANNMHFMSGSREMIYENNVFRGNSLTSGGSNIALHMGASIARHVYYAHNHSSHIYGGDHEAFTLDGHATAYFGKVREVGGRSFVLSGKRFPRNARAKGSMSDMHSTAVYIVAGTGVGQYRWLTAYEGNRVEIDRDWDLPPDETSRISIGGFNGRHLFIGNTAEDTGTLIQLYPPNCECIVAENRSIRASNINSLGKLGKHKTQDFVRVELSWFNQFLDNQVIVGNTWGGGCTQIDRWIGGESALNIWGWEVFYDSEGGADYDEFMSPEVLRKILGEPGLRDRSLPISRFQMIRRHRVDQNSSIRVHGAVTDVLIEGCDLCLGHKGIRIDMEMDYQQPADIGQLFDFDPEAGPANKPLPFLCPEAVLIRKNRFRDVAIPYSGTAISTALKIPDS
ncbi:MAG: glycosyl hydrolase family 28-related protein, partial [Kiritimatiellia bacterium]|nr:glycosyl hydrolase family 28-related protein [Kiritimatiellia bacterium]